MATKVDPLSILFGNQARVKLLRFFLFNPSTDFTFDEISRRAKLVRRTARTEINALERAEVIRRKQIYVQLEGKNKKTRAHGYALNDKFPELEALQRFLFETAPINQRTLLRHLRKAGKLDFVCMSGVFVREFERRLDVLIAMEKVSEAKVEAAIRSLESELGIEIRFATLQSEDLKYRVGMYDKLTRDVFDYKHKILVDKLDIKNEVRRS
ncbi:MAG: hypothetical protein WDZ93_01975 [Candidatus Paceibacterota bacterium]